MSVFGKDGVIGARFLQLMPLKRPTRLRQLFFDLLVVTSRSLTPQTGQGGFP
jgi:hypothetical protein